jgi:hypothetical protein
MIKEREKVKKETHLDEGQYKNQGNKKTLTVKSHSEKRISKTPSRSPYK